MDDTRTDDDRSRPNGRDRHSYGRTSLMSRAGWIGSILLIAALIATDGGLAGGKYESLQDAHAAAARQPEPVESVTVAFARKYTHRDATTSIGTVIALRSITLKNELPGTVQQVTFTPGQVVEAGAVL